MLGKDHQEKQLLLLTIANHQSEPKGNAPLQRSMNQLVNDSQRQDVLTLVGHLPWVTSALQEVEFGILFWIHQRRLSGQEVLVGTSKVPLVLQVVNFQRVKTTQELLQDKAWTRIIQVVQSLTTQQLGIKVNAQQLPSLIKISSKDIVLTIKKLVSGNDTTIKVARNLMNEANIKVQPVDEIGAIKITISKYGHDKIITILGYKATGMPTAIAQAKIDHAQDGAIPPTKLNQVCHDQTPRAEDVDPPIKKRVAFIFQVATPVNDQGQASLTYTVDADPQVEGTTTKQVIFVVGGFETRAQAHVRWASLAQAAIQTLEVTDFRAGIDKTQIASTGQPTKSQVISDIRHKINNQNAKVLILEGDLTITFNNSAKIVTIVINNHGPSKTITIAGFKPITDYLDQLLEAIPPSGGTFAIPEGITSQQFDDYVSTMGNVVNAKGEIIMREFAKKYQARITSLIIPNSFTSIGNWFQNFERITSLSFGDNVTTIGAGAFVNSKLTSLDIPDLVTTIENYAFTSSPLTSLALGAKLQTIGNNAFQYSKLKSLIIPNLVTSIGDSAFTASPLTSLRLGTNLQTIGSSVFSFAQLKILIIPASVTAIGSYAFLRSPLTTITIFDDVTLGIEVFENAKEIIKKARPGPPL